MKQKLKIILKINSVYFKLMLYYSLFLIFWLFITGNQIIYSQNISGPTPAFTVLKNLIGDWKILRNIGLLFLFPSWIISLGVLIITIKSKKPVEGILVCIKWFGLHLLLILSFAIGALLVDFILLSRYIAIRQF